jgi:hypothetical protein
MIPEEESLELDEEFPRRSALPGRALLLGS